MTFETGQILIGCSEETVEIEPGLSLTIPIGADFQFRCDGDEQLTAVGVAMPPWPGQDDAYPSISDNRAII